ncbi:MAG: hypothetical protein JXQ96_20340 [Cyclobacteriaceae bacterium]
MIKRVIIFGMVLGILASCNSDEEVLNIQGQVEVISPNELPGSSQAFITSNFEGEVITDAFKVIDSNNQITYEAFMSNNTNFVFASSSSLYGFGDIHSKVEFESDERRDNMQWGMNGNTGGGMGNGFQGGNGTHNGGGMMNNGGGMMNNGGAMMNNEGGFRGHPEVIPAEVLISELPTPILDYITSNYSESEILKAFSVNWEDEIEYHVLISEVGALRFDQNGNYIEHIMRGGGKILSDMEVIEIADLPSLIVDYFTTNYPDNDIMRARKVTLEDNTIQYHVSIMEVGVFVFDENGTYIEILTQGMGRHNHG